MAAKDYQVKRKDRYVSELVDHFDDRFESFGYDIERFWAEITPDEMQVIEDELAKVLANNPEADRYYLENYHVIETKGENWEPARLQTVYPFKEPQEILWEDYVYCWDNKIPTWWILLKARQIGWSTLIQALIFKRTAFNPLTKSLIIADERVRSEKIFDMSLLALRNLPCWMCPEVQNQVKGELLRFDRKDPEKRRRNPGLNSALYCDAANKPTGSSRGFTLHNLHATEVSSYNNPKIITNHLRPALAKHNPLTISCLESTAEGRGYFYHRLWEDAMAGKVRWRPVFAAWWKEKTYSKPFRNQTQRKKFGELTEKEQQIRDKVEREFGYSITDEQFHWRREEAADFEALSDDQDAENVEQEYPSFPRSAWRAQGRLAFPQWKLEEIERKYISPPVWCGDIHILKDKDTGELIGKLIEYPEFRPDAPLWIWQWPEEGLIYYEAGDPGEGIPGNDFSGVEMILVPKRAAQPLEQVAEYRAWADGTHLAKVMYCLGKMYNWAEAAPECNRITTTVTDLVHVYRYPRLYRWRQHDKVKNRFTNYLGWLTNSKTRPAIIDRFRTLLMEDAYIIRSERLMDECYEFIDIDGTGKFEGANTDDLVLPAMFGATCALDLSASPLLQETEVTVPKGNPDATFKNTDYSPLLDGEMGGGPDFANL